jgi:hypothetical protein
LKLSGLAVGVGKLVGGLVGLTLKGRQASLKLFGLRNLRVGLRLREFGVG